MDNIKFLKEQMGFKELWLDYGWKDGFWWHHNLWTGSTPHSQVIHPAPYYKVLQGTPGHWQCGDSIPLLLNKLIKQITDSVHQNSRFAILIITMPRNDCGLCGWTKQLKLDSFNLSDGIIGHNTMNKFWRNKGCGPLVDLGSLLYDNPQPLQNTRATISRFIRGNLIDANSGCSPN